MIYIVEPSKDSGQEFGHTRVGLRYLLRYFSQKDFEKHEIKVFLSNSMSFESKSSRDFEPVEFQIKKVRPKSILIVIPRVVKQFILALIMRDFSRWNFIKVFKSLILNSLTNNLYREFSFKSANILVFQDFSFETMPNFRNLSGEQILCLRTIGKPPHYLEKLWLRNLTDLQRKLGSNLRFSSENSKVLDWLSSKCDFPIYHVPWFSFLSLENPKKMREIRVGRTQIYFPGSQRISKGLNFIPGIIKHLSPLENAKYIIQESNEDSDKVRSIYRELREMNNVEILPALIDNIDYRRMISESDLCILPYFDPGYEWTASGILIDLVSDNCPILAPENSAVGYEIRKYELGSTFRNPVDLLESVRMALKEDRSCFLEKYLNSALVEIELWLSPTTKESLKID
jgi:hypothetical protein